MAEGKFILKWLDRGREPQCKPNPDYPDGIDVVLDNPAGVPTCKTALPYPAKRCGMHYIQCEICGTNALITTAGRPDDPRSVEIPCKIGDKQ